LSGAVVRKQDATADWSRIANPPGCGFTDGLHTARGRTDGRRAQPASSIISCGFTGRCPDAADGLRGHEQVWKVSDLVELLDVAESKNSDLIEKYHQHGDASRRKRKTVPDR
jgi:hypothetical protein